MAKLSSAGMKGCCRGWLKVVGVRLACSCRRKRELIARFSLKAVAAGSLSNLMSAALAGMLLVV